VRTRARGIGPFGPLYFAPDNGDGSGAGGTGAGSGAAGGDAGDGGAAGGAGDGGAAGGTGGAGDGGSAGAGDAGKTYTQAELDAAMAKLRKENADNRTKLSKLDADAKLAEQAKLTADEKKAAELAEKERLLAERETRAQARVTTAAIVEAVGGAGAPAGKIQLLSRLIDRDAVEFDDAGEPTNVAALVAALKKENPDLFAASSSGGAGGGSADGGSRGSGAALTKEQIKKMTAAEINARWPEVQKVLAGG
jgi:hypothetical protein